MFDKMKGAYFGPKYEDKEIEVQLNQCGAVYKKLTKNRLLEEVATALVNEKAIGWMQGNMEFGPRALGNRSICKSTFTVDAETT